MGFAEMLEHFNAADLVITHAGVGSILCARRAGHVPIVVPRQSRYGEHVDDHQVELVRALEERDAVIGVWETEQLPQIVESTRRRSEPPPAVAHGRLPQAVREAVLR